jgi:hypothetical protein
MGKMTSLKPRLLNVLAFLSLLLCLAAVALWGWNHWRVAHGRFAGEWNETHVVARPAGVYVAWARLHRPQAPAPWAFGTYSARGEDVAPVFSDERPLLGFRAGSFAGASYSGTPCAVRYLVVPHWFLAAACAVLPAAWVWRQERLLRRRNRGQCPRCGYDVRTTPGRCLECGTEVRVVLIVPAQH